MVTPLAAVLTEAAVELQVQESAAETPELGTLELNLFLSGFDMALTCACCFFPCRATGLVSERMKPSITADVRRFDKEEGHVGVRGVSRRCR